MMVSVPHTTRYFHPSSPRPPEAPPSPGGYLRPCRGQKAAQEYAFKGVRRYPWRSERRAKRGVTLGVHFCSAGVPPFGPGIVLSESALCGPRCVAFLVGVFLDAVGSQTFRGKSTLSKVSNWQTAAGSNIHSRSVISN
eukprot:3518262-Rhodomonas_salina.1